MYWNQKTWYEIEANRPEVVLVPIGSVEAHGPHLPLSTDTVISDEIARRAAKVLIARGVKTLILPALQYVITDFSKDFPGTISVSKNAFQLLLQDICDSLAQQKIAAVCIINSHLEPNHIAAISEFTQRYTGLKVLFPDKTKKPWASLLTREFKSGACHAGSYETSLVLAAKPDLVHADRVNLPPLEVNLAQLMKDGIQSFKQAGAHQAYFGDPASASVNEGESTYEILTRMIVETVVNNL